MSTQGLHSSTMCDRNIRKMVKIGTELIKFGTEFVKIGTEWVKFGTGLVRISQNWSNSEQNWSNWSKLERFNGFSESSEFGTKFR